MSALSTLAADTVMSIHFFAIIFLFIGWLSTRAKIRRLHLIMTVAGLVSQLITGACPLWTLESSLRGIDAGKGFLNHYGIMLPFGATFAILFGILMVSFMRNFASRRLPILQAITGVLVMIVVMGYGECFIAGTEILMADGSVKPIEEIEIGDTVLGMDGAKNTIVGLYRYRLGAQPLYAINNDGEYFVTAAHPFWTTTGWQAINPAAAEKWNPNLEISRLDEGDILILEDGEKIVKNIRAKQSNYFTTIYNFTTDGNQTYYADGYLVHNKGGGGTGTATGIGDQGNGFAGANGSNGFGGTVGGTTGGNGAIGDCFTGDTPITMADGSHRNIENIRTGDEVLAWDFETDAPVPVEVDWTWRGPHEDMYVINGAINVTAEHPFWTRELGWAAINPKETLRKHNWQPAQLAVGQYFMDAEKNYIEVTSIESNAGEVMTYNFGVPGYKNYFAADVLVHNKDAVPAGCATCIGIECFDLNCPATPAPDVKTPKDSTPPEGEKQKRKRGRKPKTSSPKASSADSTPPVFNGVPVVFAADAIKSLDGDNLGFSDASLPLTYQFKIDGVDISGPPYTYDFSQAGKYQAECNVTDAVGNSTGWQTIPDFFHVVANIPEWDVNNCSGDDYQTTCPSTLTIPTSADTKIADNADYHTVNVKLADKYGNPVISETDIKNVNVIFNFDNTNDLDQIVGSGDPSRYVSSEFSLDKNPGGDNGDNTDWLTEAAGGDGVFEVKVHSYTPTSAGYTPIEDDDFDLSFVSIDYLIENISAYDSVGATAASVQSPTIFAFSPILVATPEALIWNGSNYVSDANGVKNITVNAPKRFRVSLDNADDTNDVSISSPGIGIALNSEAGSNITWVAGATSLEEVGLSALTEDLTLDTNLDLVFNSPGTLKDLTSWIGSITDDDVQTLRFRATPALDATDTGDNLTTILQTYVCYTVDGTVSKKVCHRSGKLASGTDVKLRNPGIEIIGSVKSEAGTSSKQTDAALNKSFGDIAQSEFKNAINRNVLNLTKNPASNVCKTVDEIIDATSDFDSLSCKNNEGNIFYFRNHDVVLGDGVNPLALPSGAKTVLIENGDLHIKSNLTYPVGNSNSFGVIILNGNIFIYPGVTNVVGAYYAEGSVISVNADGESGEDDSPDCSGVGFCDRSFELRNQLYWKGLIATQNTIGGADKDPTYECPAETTCNSRENARVYDLAYLRTFHADSGVTPVYSDSDAALVVEYDSRIQNSPPPLFEFSTRESGNQLGSDFLNIDNEIHQPEPSRNLWEVIRSWF